MYAFKAYSDECMQLRRWTRRKYNDPIEEFCECINEKFCI